MSTERPDPIFCTKIGDTNPNTPNELQCCSPNTQNSTLCRSIFSNPLNSDIFTGTCFAPGHDCLADCQHPRLIYSSKVQDDYEDGNGSAPKNRYLACVNVPNMAGATVQTASFTFGIFNADMLNVFLLLPLTTNGILPIVLAYILLIRHHKATPDITVLTTICWILASVVYWILYSHVIPINGEIQNKKANYSA
ncbi:hypothetical protein A1F96_04660 [Pyrenophora tritici-repentis]|nr:hypothetical protein A1F96_04660 [Pyrenophora tritici-repentis]